MWFIVVCAIALLVLYALVVALMMAASRADKQLKGFAEDWRAASNPHGEGT